MTVCPVYRLSVAGRIGPMLRTALADLEAEEVPRHHVLLIPAREDDVLLALLEQLDARGIEVDRVSAWYW
jgi:hypothetical protein